MHLHRPIDPQMSYVWNLSLVPKDDDDDLPDADYDDDDVFDSKDDPVTTEQKKPATPAKRRSQSLSALKDKDERSPRKVRFLKSKMQCT